MVDNVENDQRRVSVDFGIGYDDDIDAAREAIIDEGEAIDEGLSEPAATAPVTGLGDSAVVLQGRIRIDRSVREEAFADIELLSNRNSWPLNL